MKLPFLLLLCFCLIVEVIGQTTPVVVTTTSGKLQGTDENGVMSFKGVRFGQPATGPLRWEPPVPFISAAAQNATTLAPSCIQQFAFASSAFTQSLFNNPPPVSENEDCLFLNVWAPSSDINEKKPVLFWLYGGGFVFGTGSLPGYDGTSLAANQNIVVVTINYRTNIFGFPRSSDIPITKNNLGLLDQELALQWVQLNIARFGGDPDKVTIMGQSAGAGSVGLAIVRDIINTPFRAGILLSGAPVSSSPTLSFSSFDDFAKTVPAATIRNFTNGPLSGAFGPIVDNVTVFTNPIERIRSGATAGVPIILGNMENDGSVFVVGMTNLTAFIEAEFPGTGVTADLVRSLYPGQNDTSIIASVDRDVSFRCPDELWSAAVTGAGVSSVFRYTYGAVFADLQKFPGAGAWHSSEIGPLFGTFNRSTATPAEVTWSSTFQTAIANFVKNPEVSPAVNWPKYVAGPPAKTFAKLAYNGNVEPGNFVDPVASGSLDGPCDTLWNKFLDFTA
ncbi:Alpha/Beta hydrolase protein [Mycena pura]|uniref:Carboxylic ester hydrolase n=1 Tax=Mycena pura TaxID=153505 RepID=A0AAD6VV26_9AGAR|nr:Alpha/Beta hydrolase protein [Mycena pura]